MAIDPDAVLLDRVFQPLTDALADRVSPFGLARGALVLAVEAQALVLFWNALADPTTPGLALCATIGGLTLFGAWQAWRLIGQAERQCRAATMNVRRITLRRQRMLWLGVGAGCTAALLPQANIRAAFAVLSCLVWVGLIYFVSCTPRPPARAASRRWSGSALPAAGR